MDVFKHHARTIAWEVLKAQALWSDYPYAKAKFDALKPTPTGSPLECAKAEYVAALSAMYSAGIVTPQSRDVIDTVPDLACGDLSGSQLLCVTIPTMVVPI